MLAGGSTVPNLIEPHHRRDSKVCRVLSHEFGVVRLYRTFSSTPLQGKQGVQGAYAIVWDSSSASNLLEPHHRRDNEMKSTKVQTLGAECDVVSVRVWPYIMYNMHARKNHAYAV